ncbi:hypothetical protein ACIA8K_33055 [Catenuloplanes sp. NPDC051500]|uniref:hypothetical protein n=1 Tax=Catenuloplanes sp. NPDC051500 TaxID=3363959 RepID=UPI0037AD7940
MSGTDHDARRLLRPLAGEPEHAPRIDVAAAMRDGTRLRRRRTARIGAAFATVFAVTAAAAVLMQLPDRDRDGAQVAAGPSASSGSAPPVAGPGGLPAAPEGAACVSSDVERTPLATDRTGRWTVTDEPALWRDGELVSAVATQGGQFTVSQINSAGTFAATTVDDTTQPWAYVDGTPTLLRGGAGRATAVSEQGRFGGRLGELPVVWDAPDADPALLPLPAGFTSGEVVAVGDDGETVLGTVGTGRTVQITDTAGTGTGLLWLAGGDTRLLPLPPGADWVRPTAMRDDWVVGLVSDGSAFRYDIARDTMETLPAQITWPSAVGADGAVAGLSVPAPVVPARGYRAVLLTGGVVRTLRPDDPADTLYEISGLSDDGTVTGFAVGAPTRGFTSRCG